MDGIENEKYAESDTFECVTRHENIRNTLLLQIAI